MFAVPQSPYADPGEVETALTCESAHKTPVIIIHESRLDEHDGVESVGVAVPEMEIGARAYIRHWPLDGQERPQPHLQ
jgi:hypothetical protein